MRLELQGRWNQILAATAAIAVVAATVALTQRGTGERSADTQPAGRARAVQTASAREAASHDTVPREASPGRRPLTGLAVQDATPEPAGDRLARSIEPNGGTSTGDEASETYGLYRASQSPAPIPLLPDQTTLEDQVQGAEARIVRHDDAVEFTLTTTGLEKHAYTVWLVVFNVPELCRDPDPDDGRNFRCGPGDVPNPAAGFSIMYGAGHEVEVEEDELDAFAGERARFDRDGVILGPGLLDPRGAEIHLIVRDHGPCDDDGCGDRTTTVDGGCSNPHFGGLFRPFWGEPGDYECSAPQATGY